jgi:hypothetical protein
MTYTLIEDPGHGWLKVERIELKRLGIADKISSYSYQSDGYIYLEEDCDMTTFVLAKRALGEVCEWRTIHQDPAPVRDYESYRA